jgi:hypothetical protein
MEITTLERIKERTGRIKWLTDLAIAGHWTSKEEMDTDFFTLGMRHDSALKPVEEEESDKILYVLQFNVSLFDSRYSWG